MVGDRYRGDIVGKKLKVQVGAAQCIMSRVTPAVAYYRYFPELTSVYLRSLRAWTISSSYVKPKKKVHSIICEFNPVTISNFREIKTLRNTKYTCAI